MAIILQAVYGVLLNCGFVFSYSQMNCSRNSFAVC